MSDQVETSTHQPHANARQFRLKKFPFGKPGQPGPAAFALYSPKPRLWSVHHNDAGNEKPRLSPGFAADHCGATSVASALGVRSGATPGGHDHHNIHSRFRTLKPDISKWQAIGHFYLALTPRTIRRTIWRNGKKVFRESPKLS